MGNPSFLYPEAMRLSNELIHWKEDRKSVLVFFGESGNKFEWHASQVHCKMFKDDKLSQLYKYWRDFKPEEELYARLKDNPFYPFKQIGDGYFYVSYRSDRVVYGLSLLVLSVFSCALILGIVGPFSMFFSAFIMFFSFVYWTLHGKMAWRELIISRRGRGKYMLRIFQNEEILFTSDIRNVYIRLTRKVDALADPYFCLVLGGFELDDHRITRMTKAEGPLRIMGMRIAYRVGINFFDWKDESEEHLIWHYRGHSKLKCKAVAKVAFKKEPLISPRNSGFDEAFLSIPGTTGRQPRRSSMSPQRRKTSRMSQEDDDNDDAKNKAKKVRIDQNVKVSAK